MNGFYEGVENSLLTLGFVLGLAAFAALSAPPRPPAPLAITLPMLSVTSSGVDPAPAAPEPVR